MSPITIRKATISDLEIIQEISTQTFIETFAEVNAPENMEHYVRENFNSEQVTSEIHNPDSAFYLATLDSETIGYLKLNFGNAQNEIVHKEAIEIHRIYVSKAFFGKKVGQLLLYEAVRIAKYKGVNAIWEENHRAIRFYSKNGFVEFDKHSFLLGDEQQTDLLMQLDINKK
jgi:ribosomal protein S18 acetylase RimI-like enzyme